MGWRLAAAWFPLAAALCLSQAAEPEALPPEEPAWQSLFEERREAFQKTAARQVVKDTEGLALPAGAVMRLGTLRFRAQSPIQQVLYSHNGQFLLTKSSSDTFVNVWDAATGRAVGRLQPQSSYLSRMVLSPDDKCVAIGGYDERISILEVPSGKLRFHVASAQGSPVAFSPDGRALAVAGKGGEVELWGMASRERTGALKAPPRPEPAGQKKPFVARRNPLCLVFAPDGQTLAAAHSDGYVCLWRPETGAVLTGATLKTEPPSQPLSRLAFGPAGKGLLAGSHIGRVRFVELPGLEQRYELALEGTWQASADGGLLATVGRDGNLSLYDVATGKLLRKSQAPVAQGMASALAFSPDGKVIAIGRSHAVFFCEVATAARLPAEAIGHAAMPSQLVFSPDGKRLVTASSGEACEWDLAAGQGRMLPAPPARLGSVCYDPATDRSVHVISEGLETRRISTGEKLLSLPLPAKAATAQRLVRFSSRGSYVLCGEWERSSANASLHLWEAATGKLLARRDDAPAGYLGAFTSDERLFFLASSHRAFGLLFSFCSTLTLRQVFQLEIPSGAADAARSRFTPGGRLVLIPQGRFLRGVDMLLGTEIGAFDATSYSISGLDLSPDGRLVAVCSSAHVGAKDKGAVHLAVWDWMTGGKPWRPPTDPGLCGAVAFSPDSRRLVSAMQDTTTLMWAIPERAAPAPLSAEEAEAAWKDLGHERALNAYLAQARLARGGDAGVALLRAKLKPVAETPDLRAQVEAVLKKLDAPDYDVREAATEEARRMGRTALAMLQQAASAQPTSLELHTRLRVLAAAMDDPRVGDPELRRQIRGVDILEYIASPEARALLSALAQGAPGARLTLEAQAALARARAAGPEGPR